MSTLIWPTVPVDMVWLTGSIDSVTAGAADANATTPIAARKLTQLGVISPRRISAPSSAKPSFENPAPASRAPQAQGRREPLHRGDHSPRAIAEDRSRSS